MGSDNVRDLPPKCSKCHENIEGAVVTIDGKQYHPECAPRPRTSNTNSYTQSGAKEKRPDSQTGLRTLQAQS